MDIQCGLDVRQEEMEGTELCKTLGAHRNHTAEQSMSAL